VLSKVPPQPLWFAPGLANVRKLQELPYQLLRAGLWEELQQEVVGEIKKISVKLNCHYTPLEFRPEPGQICCCSVHKTQLGFNRHGPVQHLWPG